MPGTAIGVGRLAHAVNCNRLPAGSASPAAWISNGQTIAAIGSAE